MWEREHGGEVSVGGCGSGECGRESMEEKCVVSVCGMEER